MTKKAPEKTRQAIIDSSIQRILDHGAASLSMDAVAADAGVSKGGLLHHFPTKAALVEGVLTEQLQSFDEALRRELATEDESSAGRWHRAYIRATFDGDPAMPRILSQIWSVFQESWGVADEFYAASPTLQPPADGLMPGRALLIRAACDGWWYGEFFDWPLVTEAERAELREELLRLAR
ncbi:MAG: TetR/AcrR family transcriptional regulator [Thermomicrobiales bacterium]|nr:TetR/AcrR family transcriptional regulator [Thermomicrobiales bacterium]